MSRRNHAHAEDVRRRDLGTAGLGLFDSTVVEPAPPVREVPVHAHMRRIEGPPRPSGEAQKDAALAAHEADVAKRAAIVYVRARLLTLYRSRLVTDPHADVNADDVDAILRAWPQFDPAIRDGSQKWRGVIFAGKGWQRSGKWTPSTRPEMNGHLNPGWRPVL